MGRFSVSKSQDETPAVSLQAPEPQREPHVHPSIGNGPAQSPLNNTISPYLSSDNDSEFEDEDFKREVSRLREKYVCFCDLYCDLI